VKNNNVNTPLIWISFIGAGTSLLAPSCLSNGTSSAPADLTNGGPAKPHATPSWVYEFNSSYIGPLELSRMSGIPN